MLLERTARIADPASTPVTVGRSGDTAAKGRLGRNRRSQGQVEGSGTLGVEPRLHSRIGVLLIACGDRGRVR